MPREKARALKLKFLPIPSCSCVGLFLMRGWQEFIIPVSFFTGTSFYMSLLLQKKMLLQRRGYTSRKVRGGSEDKKCFFKTHFKKN